jgi:hypothetical protein
VGAAVRKKLSEYSIRMAVLKGYLMLGVKFTACYRLERRTSIGRGCAEVRIDLKSVQELR